MFGKLVSGSRSKALDDKWPDDFHKLNISSPNSTLHIIPSGTSSTSRCSSPSITSSPSYIAKSTSSLDSKLSFSSTDASKSSPSCSRTSSTNASKNSYGSRNSSGFPKQSFEIYPTGNICPSIKIPKGNLMTAKQSQSFLVGSGSGTYGYGTVIQCNPAGNKRTTESEKFRRAGNDMYNQGKFDEALGFYDTAIALVPSNAAYRNNRAAALISLGLLGHGLTEYEEAVRLDPTYLRPREKLVSLLIRLGQVDEASRHIGSLQHSKHDELRKVQKIAQHINLCGSYRRMGDWEGALQEANSAINSGADACPQLLLCKAEAHLKLLQLAEAEAALMTLPLLERLPNSSQQYFGMLCEAYPPFVISQIEMASGRFENALVDAENAKQIDERNDEVEALLNHVKLVTKARTRGNDLVKSDRLTEACTAYTEGLNADPTNSILRCNRAIALFKLGRYERCIDDCNHALLMQPRYQKALLRRAASNIMLERWAEAVSDYELLTEIVPEDTDVAEYLFHAQVALRTSRGEDTQNMRFGGVENVTTLARFKDAISFPGVSMVHFKEESNAKCKDISPFVDELCNRYRTINFLTVDVGKCRSIGISEKIMVEPTFKVYKNGRQIIELTCPSREALEEAVKDHIF